MLLCVCVRNCHFTCEWYLIQENDYKRRRYNHNPFIIPKAIFYHVFSHWNWMSSAWDMTKEHTSFYFKNCNKKIYTDGWQIKVNSAMLWWLFCWHGLGPFVAFDEWFPKWGLWIIFEWSLEWNGLIQTLTQKQVVNLDLMCFVSRHFRTMLHVSSM